MKILSEKLLEDCREVLEDKSFQLTAEKLVLKSGIRADLKGFSCLIDAVIIYGTGVCKTFCDIYGAIAALRSTKTKTIMREISYAIEQSYGLSECLSRLLDIPIDENDIHSGLVIAYLGRLFVNPDINVYA